MKHFIALAGLSRLVSASCGSSSLQNFVTFGDSYTDDGRLGYFINNQGQAPPAGQLLEGSSTTASGGYAWGRIVAQKTGAAYFNYAVSGATCSNAIISRDFAAINAPFPDVLGYQIPAFKADTEYEELYENRTAENTVYALWIGTNDLGYGAFLSDSQTEGTTITSYIDCVWEVFDNLYEAGGRNFALLNTAPLDQSPLYNLPELGGTLDSQFWANKTAYNITEYKNKILEYTTSVNTIFEYGVPFQLTIKERWPEATFSLFDVHKLLLDIHENPAEYLELPYNVTGYYRHCQATDNSKCVDSSDSKAAFLWYDELHPSERADEIIAEHFIDVIDGQSKYGTTYKS